MDYPNTFAQLGAELRNLRKTEALFEQSHFADNALYSKRLLTGAYSSSVNEEEIAATNGKYDLENNSTPAVQAIHSSQMSTFETSFFPVLDVELSTSDSDKAAGAIQYVYDSSLTNGQVAILNRNGRFGALRKQMLADAQTVVGCTLSYGAFVTTNSNTGAISTATSTMVGADHTLSGTVIFECVDDTVDAPKLSITNYLAKKLVDGTEKITADNLLTVGKSYQDGPTGLTCSVVLGTIAETGDTGNMISASTVTTPTESDSNKGYVYIYVERQAADPTWLIQWYSDAALTRLVAQSEQNAGGGTVAVSMTGASGMIVAFPFHAGNANTYLPATGNNGTVTLNIGSPRIGNTWKKTVTNDYAGNFATKLAKRYRVSLPSATPAGSISDALASSVAMS
jgi:hypothetical protein